jgi:protocatechuate 3,4-dioxygenase beta subunit
MRIISRRCLIKLGLLGGLASGLGCGGRFGNALALPTPAETEGPFYPVNDQADKDADLTHIDGHGDSALGQYILISGRITDVAGHPLANNDCYLASRANGRYHHPLDSNPAPADANFQGWAIIVVMTTAFSALKP